MSDAYVPENDALEQAQEVEPAPLDDDGEERGRALTYPDRTTREADEADVLEQSQEVPWDDEHE